VPVPAGRRGAVIDRYLLLAVHSAAKLLQAAAAGD